MVLGRHRLGVRSVTRKSGEGEEFLPARTAGGEKKAIRYKNRSTEGGGGKAGVFRRERKKDHKHHRLGIKKGRGPLSQKRNLYCEEERRRLVCPTRGGESSSPPARAPSLRRHVGTLKRVKRSVLVDEGR